MRKPRGIRGRPAHWLVALAALAAGAAQAQDEAAVADDDTIDVATPCINHATIRRTRIIDARNIAFFMRDGKIYNNQLPRECPSLRRGSIVNYAIANSRVCQGTQFQVMWEAGTNNFVPAFVCMLGTFVPITVEQLEDLEELTATERRSNRRRRAREPVTEPVDLP